MFNGDIGGSLICSECTTNLKIWVRDKLPKVSEESEKIIKDVRKRRRSAMEKLA